MRAPLFTLTLLSGAIASLEKKPGWWREIPSDEYRVEEIFGRYRKTLESPAKNLCNRLFTGDVMAKFFQKNINELGDGLHVKAELLKLGQYAELPEITSIKVPNYSQLLDRSMRSLTKAVSLLEEAQRTSFLKYMAGIQECLSKEITEILGMDISVVDGDFITGRMKLCFKKLGNPKSSFVGVPLAAILDMFQTAESTLISFVRNAKSLNQSILAANQEVRSLKVNKDLQESFKVSMSKITESIKLENFINKCRFQYESQV